MQRLRNANKTLAERYELAKILSGKSIDWNDEYLSQNDDDLGKALLKLIWLNGPLDQMNPTTEQMEIGLEILTKEQATANRIDIIRWKMLQSYVDEERSDDALEIIKTISLESDSDGTDLSPTDSTRQSGSLRLARSKHEESRRGWIGFHCSRTSIPNFTSFAGAYSAQSIRWRGLESSSTLAVHVFVQTLELDNLSKILLEDDLAITTYPHETLLLAHLLGAHHDEESWIKARKARKKALQVIQSTDVPDSIDDDEYKLLLLLEGQIEESVNKLDLTGRLLKKGILAINQIVKALSSGGSHLVDEKHLGNLIDSLEEGEVTGLSEALLQTIVSKLRLNNARLSLQRGDDSNQVVATLESVLNQPSIPYPIVQGVRQLMYEFDLGIEALVQWYQQHHQRSIWALLAQLPRLKHQMVKISRLLDCLSGQLTRLNLIMMRK